MRQQFQHQQLYLHFGQRCFEHRPSKARRVSEAARHNPPGRAATWRGRATRRTRRRARQRPGSGTTPTGRPPGGGFFGRAGGNSSKFRAAFKACGADFRAGGRRGGFNRQNIQKYVTCVRQHGYNLPEPNFSGNGPVFPANIRTNKKFQSASKACQSLLAPPQGAGGAGGTGGGSSTYAGPHQGSGESVVEARYASTTRSM